MNESRYNESITTASASSKQRITPLDYPPASFATGVSRSLATTGTATDLKREYVSMLKIGLLSALGCGEPADVVVAKSKVGEFPANEVVTTDTAGIADTATGLLGAVPVSCCAVVVADKAFEYTVELLIGSGVTGDAIFKRVEFWTIGFDATVGRPFSIGNADNGQKHWQSHDPGVGGLVSLPSVGVKFELIALTVAVEVGDSWALAPGFEFCPICAPAVTTAGGVDCKIDFER
ncbi:MAG: hypothetical protein LQ351_004855 [Letrouitia transgressa]|nr:MAG: hypothetical protein LQ351_004855 [Letrouitia transgressa]